MLTDATVSRGTLGAVTLRLRHTETLVPHLSRTSPSHRIDTAQRASPRSGTTRPEPHLQSQGGNPSGPGAAQPRLDARGELRVRGSGALLRFELGGEAALLVRVVLLGMLSAAVCVAVRELLRLLWLGILRAGHCPRRAR